MATYASLRAKGRMAELANRVINNDPADAKFVIIPVSTEVVQATGEDLATFTAYLGAGGVELTTGGWGRITLTDTSGLTVTFNTTLNRTEVDAPDQSFGSPASGTTAAVVLCYGNVAAPTNAQLEFLTNHTWAMIGDGAPMTLEVSDIFRSA